MIPRRARAPIAWSAAVVLALVGGFWAAQATLQAPAIATKPESAVLYTVMTGTVGKTLTFTAEARWPSASPLRNGASGTITTVDIEPGQRVSVGDRLYSVDLRPVSIAEGRVPAFRDMRAGTHGADVRQLQSFLAKVGHAPGSVKGQFDAATAAAVEAWQRASGVEPDGMVRRGDLVFSAALPLRVKPAEALALGAMVSVGDELIEGIAAAPVFTITLSQDQTALIPLTGAVRVHHPNGTWEGSIATSTNDANGQLVLTLAGKDGEPLCANECDQVPLEQSAVYGAEIVAVPTTSGPLVPIAALLTSPDGSVSVLRADGHSLHVEIEAASGGYAVVSGLSSGTRIRLFGDGTSDGPVQPGVVRPSAPAAS